MTKDEIEILVEKQRSFFKSGKTLDIKYRIKYLKGLYNAIKKHENELYDALYYDLGKSKREAFMCEIGLVLSEISYMLKHIKKWAAPQKRRTAISQFPAKCFTICHPYGTVLIMSPWNYPFFLCLEPLVEAIAAGNTAIIKTSEYSINTNLVVSKIIEDVFSKEYVSVVFGGLVENQALIHSCFDYIFFTGSKNVGNVVYQAASKRRIPVTLELGGKSPCIVSSSAKIKMAAKRIVFGKLLNAGQTCVAPDYIFVSNEIHDAFIAALKEQINKQYGDYLTSPNYGKIINKHHFERIVSLIEQDKVVYGGHYDEKSLKIEPTILDDVSFSSTIMSQEIFGPLFPIVRYDDLDEVIEYVNGHDAPLACYIFSEDRAFINKIIRNIGFGGGCINDTIIHLASSHLPFGGYKESGMGSYHGKNGFYTFSHVKSIVKKKAYLDMPMRYSPYNKKHDKLLTKILK